MLQMPRLVSLLLMATLIVILGLTFYQVVAPFLMPLFLAAVLAMICQPVYHRLLGWTRNRSALAAALTTVAVLLPPVLGTVAAATQLQSLARAKLTGQDLRRMVAAAKADPRVQSLVHRYGELTGETVQFDTVDDEVDAWLRDASSAVAGKTLGFAGSTLSLLGRAAGVLIGAMTFVIAFYYFLADGPTLIESTVKLIPVQQDYQRQLIGQFDQAVRAVVLATFAAAIGQGIATAIGMQIAGCGHFFVMAILATLTALVPLLGTWLVWGPYAAWMAYNGQWVGATMLTLYGALFVGLLDNVIRTYVLHSNVKLHPLLAFVSVLGGIQVLGLWGVFIGPIVASCLHALVQIFNAEVIAFSLDRQTVAGSQDNLRTAAAGTPQPDALPAVGSSAIPAANPAAPILPAPAAPAPPGTAPTQGAGDADPARKPVGASPG